VGIASAGKTVMTTGLGFRMFLVDAKPIRLT
jgi:hypothetical protein